MKIYSNYLTIDDLTKTVPADCELEWEIIPISWEREGGYNAMLRLRDREASYICYQEWTAALYGIDPDALIGLYQDVDDFNNKTNGKYANA